MPYSNAESLLPPELVSELQKYAAGKTLYVPRPAAARSGWGQASGARSRLTARNAEIRRLKAEGATIEALADRYCLSPDAIRKVLYRTTPPSPA